VRIQWPEVMINCFGCWHIQSIVPKMLIKFL
jgi:hypothetical protein